MMLPELWRRRHKNHAVTATSLGVIQRDIECGSATREDGEGARQLALSLSLLLRAATGSSRVEALEGTRAQLESRRLNGSHHLQAARARVASAR
eukprot:461026-Pleurochrysis_carterae.AAC.1